MEGAATDPTEIPYPCTYFLSPQTSIRACISFGGVFILVFVVFFAFGFLAFWLLGFLAFRRLGFLAFWLLGFWAFRLFGGFLALAFRILCIPSSFSGGGVLAFVFMRLLAALAFCILCFHSSSLGFFGSCTLSLVFGFGFPHHQHHQFRPS